MSTEQPKFKRWYDRQPKLAQGVRMLILLPDEIRTIIGEALIALANNEFDVNKHSAALRTLGNEKIIGLHKSKNRRREYDDNETLHKAMNYLYLLSDQGQDFMADHILKMMKHITLYFSACVEFQVNSNPEEIATLAATYVSSGDAGVAQFLDMLREEFYSRLFSKNQSAQASTDLLTTIQEAIETRMKTAESSTPDKSAISVMLKDAQPLNSATRPLPVGAQAADAPEKKVILEAVENKRGMKLSQE
jgi:hypothetical protein